MVSPGTLRALNALTDGDRDAFEPSIGETGELSYPTIEQELDGRDGDPIDFLESMTDRGVVSSEFEYKVYVCPDCSLEGMQYTTACHHCGSVHATRERTVVHADCETTLGQVGGDDATDSPEHSSGHRVAESTNGRDVEPDETRHCPDCDTDVPGAELRSERRYRCHDCEAWFDTPSDRLWCRDCRCVYPPADVRETPIYRYPLTNFGTEWVDQQCERRRLLAETLEARGYETSIDTTISTASGEEIPVHVSAVDELFDYRIVADVHHSPTVDDVQRLVEAAREGDAQPIILLTDGSLNEHVAELVDRKNVTVVSAADGALSREYDVSDRPREESTFISELLDSLFSPTRR